MTLGGHPLVILAADPGTPLTLAVWAPAIKALAFVEGETIAVQRKVGKTRRWENEPMLLADGLLAAAPDMDAAQGVVEAATPRPGQGVTSTASYVGSAWLIRGVLAGFGIPTTVVTATVWKRDMKLNQDKELSRKRAIELFPAFATMFARKKDHNRAEAALLAVWLERQLRNGA